MCGICGIIKFNSEFIQQDTLQQMMQIMKHRGPDDEGVFIEDNVGLGFVRLSIIDLSSAGHQPKFSDDERYVIVFNGEIYNYIELKEELQEKGVVFKTLTDTEVLLNAYIYWGEDCLHRFNGMWSFAIYDRKNKDIFCARDRFGIKPFYYLQTKNLFAFSSEIQPLLTILKNKPTPNYQSIFEFLVFNRTDQSEDTFFKEIKKLQHAHKIFIDYKVDKFQIKISKWYDLKERVSKTIGFKNAEEYKELFISALNLHQRSDVPIGVCLSGGLDSSSIVSVLVNDFHLKDLNTFSAVYKQNQVGDESIFINEYNGLLKNMFFTTPDLNTLTNDLSVFIKAQGEPIPDTSPYAQFKVMELAKGKVVVTLDGQGADEQLAGYHYFFGFYFRELLYSFKLKLFFTEIYYYLKKHHSLFGIKSLLFFMLPIKLRTAIMIKDRGYLTFDFINKFKKNSSIAGNIFGSKNLSSSLIDHFEYKMEHLLKWEDRNSMCFSIESRVPFLDYRLVEKSLATSNRLKIKDGMTKYILRDAMKGILPEKIRMRKDKIGFATPEDEWFREPAWQVIVNDILSSESFKKRNLINQNKAKHLFLKHLSGKANIANEIWKWINIELWFREFID